MAEFGDARLPQRFWDKVRVVPSGCWEWTAGKHAGGYGQVSWGGTSRRAHRVAYIALVGPIPAGLQCDHLCRVRLCCNPAHIEIVTAKENTRRSNAISTTYAKRTHCDSGHPFHGSNLQAIKLKDGSYGRGCRECRRAYQREWRAARRRNASSADKGRFANA